MQDGYGLQWLSKRRGSSGEERPLPQASDDAPAYEQPDYADAGNDEAEIAAGIPVGEGADRRTQKGDGNDQPVRPSKERNDRRNHQDQGDDANKGSQHAQHGGINAPTAGHRQVDFARQSQVFGGGKPCILIPNRNLT